MFDLVIATSAEPDAWRRGNRGSRHALEGGVTDDDLGSKSNSLFDDTRRRLGRDKDDGNATNNTHRDYLLMNSTIIVENVHYTLRQ